VFTAFALTTGRDAVKNEDLAKQLEEAKRESAEFRQESAKLRQQLEKSHEEIKEIITQENNKLRSEDSKLKREADKLKAEAEELRKENKKLRKQGEELRQRDAELERKVNELQLDNSEVKKAYRQRDQNNTLSLELQKMINKQIQEYLDDNKMCVMGDIVQNLDSSGRWDYKTRKIEFGQTFQRIPAFAAAFSYFDLKPSYSETAFELSNFRVTNSSAVVKISGIYCHGGRINWIACLWQRQSTKQNLGHI